jgi:hypothetical protein
MIEIRGIGIRNVPYEAVAAVGRVLDLMSAAERLPEPDEQKAVISGVTLPRIALPAGGDPFPAVLAVLGGD